MANSINKTGFSKCYQDGPTTCESESLRQLELGSNHVGQEMEQGLGSQAGLRQS